MRITLASLLVFISTNIFAQTKTELYDLIRSFAVDSTGYENVGDWSATNKKKSVKWKTDAIQMSEDTAINFYLQGTADIMIKGQSLKQAGQPVKWNLMLKGPRMGYTNFSIVSSGSIELHAKPTIDSIFGNKQFKAKLIKSCDTKEIGGFYYYQVKIPKKDMLYIKLGWLSINGATAYRLDCYDAWSSYAAKLECK